MPTVIQNVLAGQRRRAVAPKEGLAPLQFRLRGRLYHSWTDDTFELLAKCTPFLPSDAIHSVCSHATVLLCTAGKSP